MSMIPAAKPLIGAEEREAVDRVLQSGMLAQGPEVAAFESEFSAIVGNRHCIAVNSGTSGLHMALEALGLDTGDEVIVPSFTFAATANSVALTGATPVFVDIDPRTFNIDPKAIEAAITPKTKAIQPVHLYGQTAAMKEIKPGKPYLDGYRAAMRVLASSMVAGEASPSAHDRAQYISSPLTSVCRPRTRSPSMPR